MNQQPQSNRRGHFWSIILALIIGLIGTAWSLHHPKQPLAPEDPALPQIGEGLTIYLLPENCILATCGGDTLVIDGGSAAFGQTAADFLRGRKVQRIDLLVSSRPYEGSVGGLPTIVQNFPVKTVWASEAPSGAFADALETAGKTAVVPTEKDVFRLGDAAITVVPESDVLFVEYQYGETEGRFAQLQRVTGNDVTVYVSDGTDTFGLTEPGES